MEGKKTSVFENGLIWFGASVSIAELLTGTLIAPLGFGKGVAAILLGHVIGCVLLYCAGLIGAKRNLSAMETVRISFGKKGALFFAVMNVLQLLGWTAVMTRQGADSAAAALDFSGIFAQPTFWCVIIGLFIAIWIIIGVTNLGKVNVIVMAALFIMTIVLSLVVFKNSENSMFSEGAYDDALSFSAAVELAAAMPISWLPVISDYTRTAEKPALATSVSVVVYFIGSCWMFIIGMTAALYTGGGDVAGIMLGAGLGSVGLLIVVISTVTTTFLDAYSAGVSFVSIYGKIKERPAAVIITIIGTLTAVFAPVNQLEGFLYLIGSVFSPMIAILIADTFILKRDCTKKLADIRNIAIWIIGFIIYRIFLYIDTPVGNTLPVIVIVIVFCFAAEFIRRFFAKAGSKSK
ncbi:MAG: putative hydroxymethylpyrimidine transporter CytX [Firmicutes bacterium]|nr:putative hydroxymethylpyrimidine transporter CytX [Bacillota bacterium]